MPRSRSVLAEKLIVLLKHVHSALLIMLEISINEQDRESALLLGNLLGLFAQGISPTLSDVAVKKIQTDETGEAFPKISLFLKAEVLDEKEIGVGDLITCTVKVERKEGPKNGASISTYLGETSELRSPGVESIYLNPLILLIEPCLSEDQQCPCSCAQHLS